MYRHQKVKDEDLLRKLKAKEVVNLEEAVIISDFDNSDLINQHSLSIIARIINPGAIKPVNLTTALPNIWDLEDRVKGRCIGNNRVQFLFDQESDLFKVLRAAPWFVNGWLVTGEIWRPNPGPDFLQYIPFWVRIKGIPTHCLQKNLVTEIGNTLGRTEEVELHAKKSSSLQYVRARFWLPISNPIIFKKAVQFPSGEVITVDFDYEKLSKLCFKCKRLTHDHFHCQLSQSQDLLQLPSSQAPALPPQSGKAKKVGATKGRGKVKEVSKEETAAQRKESTRKKIVDKGKKKADGEGGTSENFSQLPKPSQHLGPVHSRLGSRKGKDFANQPQDQEWRVKDFTGAAPAWWDPKKEKQGIKQFPPQISLSSGKKLQEASSSGQVLSSGKKFQDTSPPFHFSATQKSSDSKPKRKRRTSFERNLARKRSRLNSIITVPENFPSSEVNLSGFQRETTYPTTSVPKQGDFTEVTPSNRFVGRLKFPRSL